jgi:hypothetical protein
MITAEKKVCGAAPLYWRNALFRHVILSIPTAEKRSILRFDAALNESKLGI